MATKTSQTKQFFEELAQREHEPLLARAKGTVRFDIRRDDGTEHYFLAIDKGRVDVSHRNLKADSVIRADGHLFDGMTAGKANVMAAVLRGAVTVEGDLGLAVQVERLFPGPPGSRDPRASAGYARRT
jgi:putative sterol carrier protein